VEVSRGLEYTIIKLYGENFNIDEITSNLIISGAKNEKPRLEIDIPDRPKLLSEDSLKNLRFKYPEEEREKDESLSRKKTVIATIKGVFYVIFIGIIVGFILYKTLVTKYKNVTPAKENFIAKKGNLLGYSVDGNLTLFAFADPVDELGVNENSLLFVPEDMELTDKIVVEKATDSSRNVLYDKGIKQIEFSSTIEGYNQVKSNLFKYDSYQNKNTDESDWSQYGYLGSGKAQKLIIRGRIIENETGYYISMGSGLAKLGDLAEEGKRFYDNFTDSESYITTLFSLKMGRPIYVFGQIEKTFTVKEGRNNKEKRLFAFKPLYIRFRTS
jgi:hypothetical protein